MTGPRDDDARPAAGENDPGAREAAAAALSRLDAFAAAMASVLDRCVWSQTMTHESLVPYLIEETYELVEAIEAGTPDDVMEELGDVLWQVAFHSEIASRSSGERFDIQDVAQRVTEKMVRRHPHVFGDRVAETPEQVLLLWTAAKAEEKSARRSVLDGIPLGMPALALADKVIGRGERVGAAQVAAPELVARLEGEEELGELLLGIVAAARARGLDAERALRTSVRGLRSRIARAEGIGPVTPET